MQRVSSTEFLRNVPRKISQDSVNWYQLVERAHWQLWMIPWNEMLVRVKQNTSTPHQTCKCNVFHSLQNALSLGFSFTSVLCEDFLGKNVYFVTFKRIIPSQLCFIQLTNSKLHCTKTKAVFLFTTHGISMKSNLN